MTDINISALPQIVNATPDDVIIINDADAITSKITWGDLGNSITDLTGQITFEPGTEALPSITFLGDPNTGIWQPGADQWSVSTGGLARIYIDSNGSVGIQNKQPSTYNAGATDLVVGSETDLSDSGITIVTHSTGDNIINFADGTGADAAAGQVIYSHDTNRLAVHVAGNEAFRVNNTQDLYIGTTVADPETRVAIAGGSVSVDDGNSSVPILNFRSDIDTGLFRVADDKIGVSTNGELRGVIDQDGRLGLGIENPTADIHVSRPDATLLVTDSDAAGAPEFKVVAADGSLEVRADDNNAATNSRISMYVDGNELTRLVSTGEVVVPNQVVFNNASDDVTDPYARIGRGVTNIARGLDGELVLEADPSNLYVNSAVRIQIDGSDTFLLTGEGDVKLLGDGQIVFNGDDDTYVHHPADDTIEIVTGGNSAVTAEPDGSVGFGLLGKIDRTNQRLLFGTVAPYPVAANSHEFQLTGNYLNYGASLGMFGPGTGGQCVTFLKSAGDGVTPVAVTNGDVLGDVKFAADNGVDFSSVGASISAVVDGTVGASSTPAAVVVATTPGNSVAPVERLRVAPSGALGLGGANYGTTGQLMLSGGPGAVPTWQDLPLYDISTLPDLP